MKVVMFRHAGDLSQGVPPGIELYADSAIVLPGHPLFLPDFDTAWTARIALAFRISRLGKGVSERFARRYYDACTLALLPESRALGESLGRSGSPMGLCGCYDGAVAVGKWLTLPVADMPVVIRAGNAEVTVEQPLTAADRAIASLSHYSTIKTGDIVIPCAPLLRLPLSRPQQITGMIGPDEALTVRIR